MKKMNILMIAVAMLGMAISCNKNADIPQTKSLSATASIDGEDQTKTVYAEDKNASNKPILKVNWDANETFKAYYEGSSTPLFFTKENGESFVATDVPGGVTASTPFVGVYGENVTYNPSTGKYAIDYSGQDGKLANLAKYDVMACASTTDAEGLYFPFTHKSSILKINLKRGNKDYSNSTEAGQKSVHLFFMRYEFLDDTIETTWGQNVYITLDTPLAKNEVRTIYVAIPPIKGNANEHTQPVPTYTEGYNKTVNLRSTGLTQTTLTFSAGLLYETNITYSCPQVSNPGDIW